MFRCTSVHSMFTTHVAAVACSYGLLHIKQSWRCVLFPASQPAPACTARYLVLEGKVICMPPPPDAPWYQEHLAGNLDSCDSILNMLGLDHNDGLGPRPLAATA